MKFAVNTVGKIPARLGYFIQSETGKQYHTPVLIQTTKGGSIPYLSKEVFNYITKDEQILHICLSSTDHMEEALTAYGKGISSFVGYENYPNFLSLKDSCEIAPSGYHKKDVLPIFTRKGKVELTAEKYMKIVEAFKPDMYHTLYDADTNFESFKKRIIKSVDRTEKFFQICLNIHKNSEILKNTFLFAPIVGGYDKYLRSKCIKNIPHSDVNGYIIDGFHNYGLDAINVNLNKVKEIVSHCLKEVGYKDKPRMMLGAYDPLTTIELIALGIDVFDTSYVYLTASNCKALTFNFDIQKKTSNRKFTTDMNDEKFKDDFSPILENCECLACKKHTKAYVHHLVKTKELLGPILLMIHNTHHYMEYFKTIRQLIAQDNLIKLIEFISKQKEETSDEKNELKSNNQNEIDEKVIENNVI